MKLESGAVEKLREIIAEENKQAFACSFVPPVYSREDYEINAEEVYEDMRDDKTQRGIISNCYYCGCNVRFDSGYEGQKDYPEADGDEKMAHCDGCSSAATMELCL